MGRDARRLDFRRHAAAADVGARFPRHSLHVVGDRRDQRDVFSARIAGRVGRVKPVHVRQKDQCIGHDQLRDPRCQAVIIPVADLLGGNRVVLVDNGNHAPFDEPPQRTARVEETAAVLRVFGREEHLRRRNAVFVQRLLVGMRQLHLACRGRGLQVLEPGAPLVDAEHRAADGNGARRNDEHFVTARVPVRDVFGEPAEPAPVDAAVVADQQR